MATSKRFRLAAATEFYSVRQGLGYAIGGLLVFKADTIGTISASFYEQAVEGRIILNI